jgi:opacity protein-like surface antigen
MSMSSPRSLVRSAAALLGFGAGLAASLAAAADFGLPIPAEVPSLDQNVEFGTGWYIRGTAGAALQTQPGLSPDFGSVPSAHTGNFALELGGGYQFNQWLRVDGTYTYYGNQTLNTNGASVNCPASLDPVNNGAGTIIAVAVNQNQCTPHESASLQKNLLLANAFIDIGTWYGITPYIGGGIGGAYLISEQSVNFTNNSDGSPYRATLTLPNPYPVPLIYINPNTGLPINPQPHFNTGAQNWDFSRSASKLSFAFALMAGFSYDLTKNMKLDIGYRYVNFGSFSGITSLSQAAFGNQVSTQEIRVGIRYQID